MSDEAEDVMELIEMLRGVGRDIAEATQSVKHHEEAYFARVEMVADPSARDAAAVWGVLDVLASQAMLLDARIKLLTVQSQRLQIRDRIGMKLLGPLLEEYNAGHPRGIRIDLDSLPPYSDN